MMNRTEIFLRGDVGGQNVLGTLIFSAFVASNSALLMGGIELQREIKEVTHFAYQINK